MKKLKLGIDFDGTIVKHMFPDIGEPLDEAFRVLKRIQNKGHKLILNTCREDAAGRPYLTEAIDYCRENGIEFRSVNENHADDDFRDGGGRKVYCDIYIDDRNFGGFPGWVAVEKYFEENGYL